MDFVDPHFHLWDVASKEAGHDGPLIGGPAELHPQYTWQTLQSDMAAGGANLTAAVHIEALANDGDSEAGWAKAVSADATFPVYLVAFADLSAPGADAKLKQLQDTLGTERLRGIRQILNFEPTWPKVGSGSFLTNSAWQEGFAALGPLGMSFDMQLNPHQLKDAAALVKKYPDVTVIVNHMGTLKLGAEGKDDAAETELWRTGFQALRAASDNVYVKLSMLNYTDADWDKDGSVVPGLVREIIDLFGSERCMFASNYCVDKADNWLPERLFKGFATLTEGLSDEAKANLYGNTARRAYRMA